MALLKIVELPDPLLKKKSKPIAVIDEEIKKLASDMLETMYFEVGVGLAAPQVGVLKRIIVMDPYHEDKPDRAIVMVNPEIIEKSEETVFCNEGCLSVPDYQAEVKRPEKVRVKWQDLDGVEHNELLDNFAARVVQHEIDHLNGVLFIDRISRIKRSMITKKMQKKSQNQDEQDSDLGIE
ncbi:MAG: peptide deformylase [Alphaproteobacteria bacterium]